MISSSLVYFALSHGQSSSSLLTGVSSSSGNLVVTSAVALLFLVKTPSFPFSMWLPEAHVEASWPGSVVLAGYALKFATVGILLFLLRLMGTLDLVNTSLAFSVLFATLVMSSTTDVKKLIANFSVVHMTATTFLLLVSSSTAGKFLVDFS